MPRFMSLGSRCQNEVDAASKPVKADGERCDCAIGGNRMLTWVTVKPFLKSTYLPSISPTIWASCDR